MTLQISLLRSFVAICERGTISAAAEQLNCSQATMSMRLKRLEDAVGAELFVRASRGLHLTEAGQELLKGGQRILTIHDHTLSSFRKDLVLGDVRVGLSEDYAYTIFTNVIRKFAQRNPNIKLQITTDLSIRLLKMVHQEELDFALVTVKEDTEVGEVVRQEPIVWIGADSYVHQEQGPIPLAVYPSPCVFRDAILSELERCKIPWRIVFTIQGNSGIRAAVMSGLAVTAMASSMVLPGFAVLDGSEGFPKLGDVQFRLVQRDTILSEAADLFKSALKEQFMN